MNQLKKNLLFCVPLLLAGLNCLAQDSLHVIMKRLYLEFGGDPTNLSIVGPGVFNVSLVSELPKNNSISVRYYSTEKKDEQHPTPDASICFGCPTHTLHETNLSYGRTVRLKSYLSLLFSTGPSYVEYYRPENIRTPQPGGAPFFINMGYYNFERVKYNLFGWSIRADLKIYAPRVIGLSMGGYLNFNTMMPNGGFNINLILGKLRTNKKIHLELYSETNDTPKQ